MVTSEPPERPDENIKSNAGEIPEPLKRAIDEFWERHDRSQVERQCPKNAVELYEILRGLDGVTTEGDDCYIIRGMIADDEGRAEMDNSGVPLHGYAHWWVEIWYDGVQWTIDAASLLPGHEWKPIIYKALPAPYRIWEIMPKEWEKCAWDGNTN